MSLGERERQLPRPRNMFDNTFDSVVSFKTFYRSSLNDPHIAYENVAL
jgi:hypothetical protein